MTTKMKIALAGIAYRTVAMGRAMVGKNDRVTVRRGGVRWDLDLREGIDFSIYLLGAFEKSAAVTLQKLLRPGDFGYSLQDASTWEPLPLRSDHLEALIPDGASINCHRARE